MQGSSNQHVVAVALQSTGECAAAGRPLNGHAVRQYLPDEQRAGQLARAEKTNADISIALRI